MAARWRRYLAGFDLRASGLVGCRCRCFVSAKKKRGAFCFLCLLRRANQQKTHAVKKKRGAHRKKRTSAVFCFELATDERALCLFYGALLSTYVATDERALCLFYGALCQPA